MLSSDSIGDVGREIVIVTLRHIPLSSHITHIIGFKSYGFKVNYRLRKYQVYNLISNKIISDLLYLLLVVRAGKRYSRELREGGESGDTGTVLSTASYFNWQIRW